MTAKEIWRSIAGLEDYEVSSFGRVRSYRPRGHRHYRSPRSLHPSILTPAAKGIYPKVVLMSSDGQRVQRRVHRLVLETFVGPCPLGQETRHLNGDKRDNRLGNLAWGTHAQNIADRTRHRKEKETSNAEEPFHGRR